MKSVTIRSLPLGEGRPKICVPITARSLEELKAQEAGLAGASFDLVELRVDFYEGDPMEALQVLRGLQPETPILFTFRTKDEGGEKSITLEDYEALNLSAAKSGLADLIDVELNRGEVLLSRIVKEAKVTSAKVVASYHDFGATPSKDEITDILCTMQKLDADIGKVAVMPNSEADVLTLLAAAVEMKTGLADRPYIVMSMSALGGISRLAGSLIGSALTFATAGAASAPGQMDARLVSEVLQVLG